MYDYGNWIMVFLNIGIFYIFIKESFKPTTKVDWRSFQMIMAFIIALFAEMYGFPLTIYLMTSYLGKRFNLDFTHNNGHLLNTLLGIKGDPHFNIIHLISNVLIVVGLLLLARAWKALYAAQRKYKLATLDVYKYIRHPQYLAFILIIVGFLIQWPTIITLLMAPILIIRYILLAKSEDSLMKLTHPTTYGVYRRTTPGFFPSVMIIAKNLFPQQKPTGIQ